MHNDENYNMAMWQNNSLYIEAKHGLLRYCKKGMNDINHLLVKGNRGMFHCKHLLKILPRPFVKTCDKFFNREIDLLNHTMEEVNRQMMVFVDVTLPVGQQMYIRCLCQATILQARTRLWNSDFKARVVQLKVYKEKKDVHFVQWYDTKEATFLKNTNPQLARNYLLSKTELDILRCYVQGMCRTTIAQKLYKSEGTIATHIRNVYKRLNINTHSEVEIYIDCLSLQSDQFY